MNIHITWTAEAEAKLKEIPFWARFLVRKEIEKFAIAMDAIEVNLDVYDLANQKWQSMSRK
jgi:hypothetical protein